MSYSMNRVQLIGHLGADPDVRSMPSGASVANLRVATSEKWRDKQSGENKERTEWHTVAMFGRLAEIAQEYLTKGSHVFIEGSLRTRKWQDKQGNDRYSTEVIADQLGMLGGGRNASGGKSTTGGNGGNEGTGGTRAGKAQPAPKRDEFDDGIPF